MARTIGVQHGETTKTNDAPSKNEAPIDRLPVFATRALQVASRFISVRNAPQKSAIPSAAYMYVESANVLPIAQATVPNDAYATTSPATKDRVVMRICGALWRAVKADIAIKRGAVHGPTLETTPQRKIRPPAESDPRLTACKLAVTGSNIAMARCRVRFRRCR